MNEQLLNSYLSYRSERLIKYFKKTLKDSLGFEIIEHEVSQEKIEIKIKDFYHYWASIVSIQPLRITKIVLFISFGMKVSIKESLYDGVETDYKIRVLTTDVDSAIDAKDVLEVVVSKQGV